MSENLVLALFVLLAVLGGAALVLFARRVRRRGIPAKVSQLLAGNALLLGFLLTLLLLGGEIYFRFAYDATDSLAYTKVSERWGKRHWHVNGAGCRDNIEYSAAIAPGRRRVSFIGDSFTAGHGIRNIEDRFPNRIRKTHPSWEIHVLARNGFETGDELEMLESALVKGYQVDTVVLVYCLNDVADMLPEWSQTIRRICQDAEGGGWLRKNSYLINTVYFRYRILTDRRLAQYFGFVREAYRGPIWQKQKERLRAFRDLVESHGGHLSVVTFPFLHALGPNYEYRFVHGQLDQCWRELNVPHLDLLTIYKDLPPKQITVNNFDAHPNEYANRLAAEALEEFLSPEVRLHR